MALTVQAPFTGATIQASRLTCAMCSRAIDNVLKQLPFVASVQPDKENSAFTIAFKEGQVLDIEGLEKAVEDAGFFVARFTITGMFSNTPVKMNIISWTSRIRC
ncbi:MAG: heavy metal-associated domain-containing protein [Bacteroidota bacterium]